MEKGRLKVLIIDDTKFERMIVKAYLKPYNMDIFEAVDGKEGLDVMRRNAFDLVILDFNMPVMNGRQVLEQMIGDDKLSEIPVVVYTAGGYDDEGEKMLKRSSIAFIEKSNLGEDLIPTLKEILGPSLTIGSSGQELKIKMASAGIATGTQPSNVQNYSSNDADGAADAAPPPPPPAAQTIVDNKASVPSGTVHTEVPVNGTEKEKYTVFVCLSDISSKLQIRTYLQKAGAHVVDAGNTLEVRMKAEKEPPDMLMIEDPFLETSLINIIRNPKKTIPVIVLKKRGHDFEVDSTFKEYISGVIDFPVDRVNLFTMLNDVAGFNIDV